jgi:Delta6-protoilludene synthase
VAQEADDRSKNHLRNVEEYLSLRRNTSGAPVCFTFIEFGVDLPESVLEDPIISSLTSTAVDLILIINVCNISLSTYLD